MSEQEINHLFERKLMDCLTRLTRIAFVRLAISV